MDIKNIANDQEEVKQDISCETCYSNKYPESFCNYLNCNYFESWMTV